MQKLTTKNIVLILIFVIGGFLTGLYLAEPLSRFLKLLGAYMLPSKGANILIFIVTYLITICIHELGHAIVYLREGFGMRALFLAIFLFIKEEKGWKFKVALDAPTLVGGLALPDIRPVKNMQELKAKQIGYAKVLLAGPLASLFFFLLVATLFIPLIVYLENVYWRGGLFTFLLANGLYTLFIIVSSFYRSEQVLGDFSAYKTCKNNTFFVAMHIYQSLIFSTRPHEGWQEAGFLREYLYEQLTKKLQAKDSHFFTLDILDTFLMEYLSGKTDELPQGLADYLDFLIDSPVVLAKAAKQENAMRLCFHIILYLSFQTEHREKAKLLFEKLQEKINFKLPTAKYLQKQAEQALGLVDNREFLSQKKNIYLSQMQGIYRHFPAYFEADIKLNERLAKLNSLAPHSF